MAIPGKVLGKSHYNEKRVLAITLARGGSKEVKKKILRKLIKTSYLVHNKRSIKK